MPYEGEFAGYSSLRRIVQSERVKKLLGTYKIRDAADSLGSLQILEPVSIEPSDWKPKILIAIDGSHAEVSIKNGFPGAEAAYINVVSLILDIEKMRELDQKRPVNPQKFKKTQEAEPSIDCALPGCNVISEGESSAEASLRKAVFEVFKIHKMSDDGESLLDTYEALLKHKPDTERKQKCPYEDCPIDANYPRGTNQYSCSCIFSRPLYSTDALRFHERMVPAGTNGAIFSEIMQTLERVWVIHILRTMEAQKWLPTLRRLAIVLDGPLAVFGQPAWISQAIRKELYRLNDLVRKATGGKDILLIGVEKTGQFVQHFEDIDRNSEGVSGVFPKQAVGLLTDSYIKKNIIFSEGTKMYGDATYFGRKFFYKTKSGARLVASLPFLKEDHRDMTRAEQSQYPRLADAIGLLDQLVSSRFANAFTPLVVANSEAAIPLSLGKKVLEGLAKELMTE
ncbi:DNA double-strand break repair nuclease NurA [Spirulina sp. CCNP1310]|uniref:DNA double-strand break repair nuclease NurA n=1 Tax=Spirulina sp. CCNP1310 TaxID=3110249 RepID=UPI002B1FAA5E|nr:DNA double-strand break repair nuclease NurA [Spirulina sp. CCNP1310]MEA5420230.1 DNA double-strand break repair nuclease NurA [Spirulina sp. CCNP1310]